MPSSNKKKYSKDYLQELLSLLRMDKVYHKAYGNYLFSNEGKETKQYLDFAGGFGSLLLGHNHPKIIETAQNLLKEKVCFHHQLSSKPKLNRLCAKINDLIKEQTGGTYNLTVLNTGTEAVEAAIKHALLALNMMVASFQKEIDTALVAINEMHFKRNPETPLYFEGHEFNSINDIRLYVASRCDMEAAITKPKILVSDKSFHGKTIGALAVTSNPRFRTPFIKNSPIDAVFLDIYADCPETIFEDSHRYALIPGLTKDHRLYFKKKTFSLIAAVLIEPIIGEGGLHVVPKNFLVKLRDLTKKGGIPLVFDEIQSGCYRTGHFLASSRSQVNADYYILGKSLGGGVSKISALAIDNNHYIPEFDLLHSSTFAEDDYSSAIALKSLELLIENKYRIQGSSTSIFDGLNSLKCQFPNIIDAVRGSGLMIGVNFKCMALSSSYGFQGLYRSPYFGYVLAAYLLNEWHIRVSVTLSDSRTLRLLPSIFVSQVHIEKFLKALTELCKILACGDFYSLISFLLPPQFQKLRAIENFYPKEIPLDSLDNCTNEVGFLLHYIDIDTVRSYLPSLYLLPDEVVLRLIRKLNTFSEPVIIGRNRIKNNNGQETSITFIGLSFTAKMFNDDIRESIGKMQQYQSICNKAIELLYAMGISSIGLGQYNSIIMQNGRAVSNPEVRLTTGNSYTAYTVLEKLKYAIDSLQGSKVKVGVVGAAGNIAKIIITKIVDSVDHIVLLGRSNGNLNKLTHQAGSLLKIIISELSEGKEIDNDIYDQVNKFLGDNTGITDNLAALWNLYQEWSQSACKIDIGTNLDQLYDCNIVVVATSDSRAFLNKNHFREGTVIIDISVPLNCDDTLLQDNAYTVIRGGVVELPNQEILYPPGLNLDDGQAFACMVETMLMGFENSTASYSFGEIIASEVDDIGKRIEKLGFGTQKSKKVLIH
ncbi:aminotransferase class III-fold pyridoxal phosphate-dependent enzyme [Flavobacteriaceae sp. LMIT009]